MQRRTKLKVATLVVVSAAALAVGAGLVQGGSKASAAQMRSVDKCTKLNLLTWEGYVEKGWTAPFEKKYGVKIKASLTGSEDESVAKMAAGGDRIYDIISTSSPASTSLIRLGVAKQLDLSKIPNYKLSLPFLRSSFVQGGKVYGAPYDWDVNPFLYFQSAVKTKPTSWSDLWKPEFRGKFAIWDDMGSLYIGANALGYDKTEYELTHLTDEQLQAIKNKMLQLKPRAVWTQGGDIANLLANHEVIASAPGWTYTYNQLQRTAPKAAKDLRAVVFKRHGGFAWSEGYTISDKISAACEPIAYAWLNWMMNPSTQAKFAQFVGYSPAVPAAKKFMSPAQVKALHMNNPRAWYGNALIKGDPGPLRQKYVQVWQEIKQGLK